MNLLYGEIVDIMMEEGMRFGRIRVGGALKKVSLDLLTDAGCGDSVLLADGVAISKVRRDGDAEKNDVPGNSR
jgi:hydrogenase maturation factor